jgi:hypothetical protein
MHDPSVLNRDDRNEPVVIRRTSPQNLSVYLVFEDDNASISCRVDDEAVAQVKLDALTISEKVAIRFERPRIVCGQPGKLYRDS